MAKPETIETIRNYFLQGDLLQKLPRELLGFTFQQGNLLQSDEFSGKECKGNEFILCSYVNQKLRRRLDFIYTKETFDYMPVKQVGLHRFRQLRYITRNKEEFAMLIPQILSRLLAELQPDFQCSAYPMLAKKGIPQWTFPATLPDKIGPFEKFITPEHPLDFINNSTIFLDYVDFTGGNELVFLYNRARNEFFAETKKAFFPNTIHDFDALDLPELERLLTKKLEPYLLQLAE